MVTGVKICLKEKIDDSVKVYFKKEGSQVLGYKNISLLFNLGGAEGGGNLILVKADGHLDVINSKDLTHDLLAYQLVEMK
ncbi:MAG: hypothetical protein JXL82_04725 [Candidatus Omnitrophica bacterium]|nr:hypothetical protein [Candidatus Omnitrophota bacterium]